MEASGGAAPQDTRTSPIRVGGRGHGLPVVGWRLEFDEVTGELSNFERHDFSTRQAAADATRSGLGLGLGLGLSVKVFSGYLTCFNLFRSL